MWELFHQAFAWRALAAGLLLVALCAPLGCFVLWRRMAYLGDGMSHAGMLGIAAGLMLGIGAGTGLALSSLGVGAALFFGRKRFRHAQDTLIGVMAHSALAAGIVLFSLMPNARMEAFGYLFGDVLSLRTQDLWIMAGGTLAILLAMAWQWQPLLRDALHPELAEVEGIDTQRAEAVLMFCLAGAVALCVPTTGVLMIAAFLVIPAAAARPLARTPEQMLVCSAVIGIAAVLCGLVFSFLYDVPTGPAMVLAAAVQLFVVPITVKRR